MSGIRLCASLMLASLCLPAQSLKDFEKKVTEFTLPNGLHFIIVERHEAPVVSFHTYVNAGSVDDPKGETGLAHMFEHMAFKGTETIGTKDWPQEKKAIAAVDELYEKLDAERAKGPKADQSAIIVLEGQLKRARDYANSFVIPNEYTTIIEKNGGAGLNADTSYDYTEYFYSLPSNRIELWFLMESQRFLHPVFREFYKERDVVMEEQRMRVESNPQGKLFQNFLATAFEAHPYRNPGIGWPSDVQNLRRPEARAFFEQHYVPANITMAIVGDVNPAEARRMAERYFGPMQAKPLPTLHITTEPPQAGPKEAAVESPSQPIVAVGYKRPDQYDKDDPVFDCLQLILSSGRTGLLYKQLVEDKQVSLDAEAGATFPDGRYPNLFVFLLVPAQGHTREDNLAALNDLLVQFMSKPVDAETMERVKTTARAGVIRQLASNASLASLLTAYQANYGDWRKLFTSLDDINKVTAADVQRVARRYFALQDRTVAYLQLPAAVRTRTAPRTRGGR